MYIYFAKSKYFNLNVTQTSHSQVYCLVLLTANANANGAIDHSHESHDFFFIDACTTSFKTPDGSIVPYGIIVFVKTHILLFVIVRKVLDNHEKRNRLYCRGVHCKQTTVTLLLDPEGDL